MRVAVKRHDEVEEDVLSNGEYIGRQSFEAAIRFFRAVESTIWGLAEFPGKGSPKHFDDPRFPDAKSYAVDGFPNHLILYRPIPGGILIMAVIHGARDLERFLKRRF